MAVSFWIMHYHLNMGHKHIAVANIKTPFSSGHCRYHIWHKHGTSTYMEANLIWLSQGFIGGELYNSPRLKSAITMLLLNQ